MGVGCDFVIQPPLKIHLTFDFFMIYFPFTKKSTLILFSSGIITSLCWFPPLKDLLKIIFSLIVVTHVLHTVYSQTHKYDLLSLYNAIFSKKFKKEI